MLARAPTASVQSPAASSSGTAESPPTLNALTTFDARKVAPAPRPQKIVTQGSMPPTETPVRVRSSGSAVVIVKAWSATLSATSTGLPNCAGPRREPTSAGLPGLASRPEKTSGAATAAGPRFPAPRARPALVPSGQDSPAPPQQG